MPSLFFLFSFSVACYIPILTSPEDSSSNEWIAPDNNWPAAQPPDDIDEEGLGQGQVALNLEMKDQNGDRVDLWQFYGMVILVDISSEWCAPCQELALEVEQTYQDYQEQGFMYLSILAEDNSSEIPDQAVLRKWAEDHNIESVPVAATITDMRPVLVPDYSYPRLMLIDRNMKVLNSNISPANDTNIRAEVAGAL